MLKLAVYVGITAAIAVAAYHYGLQLGGYLRGRPSREQICGTWSFDVERTTWEDARRLIRRGILEPTRGYLLIEEDGTFLIEGVPDFSRPPSKSLDPHCSAVGTWPMAFSEMDERYYRWLDYEEGDRQGEKERRRAHIIFRAKNNQLLLQPAVSDPDMGDVFLLRKR